MVRSIRLLGAVLLATLAVAVSAPVSAAGLYSPDAVYLHGALSQSFEVTHASEGPTVMTSHKRVSLKPVLTETIMRPVAFYGSPQPDYLRGGAPVCNRGVYQDASGAMRFAICEYLDGRLIVPIDK